MTKTTAEKIAVMQAYERGEKIERTYDRGGTWEYTQSPKWQWADYDYRIAAHDPIPHTIDWSHVSDKFICMFSIHSGGHRLSDRIPKVSNGLWQCIGPIEISNCDDFASFKPGNMPWQDSLVVRQVDAKK